MRPIAASTLDFITGYISEHGCAPTILEVTDGLHLSSTSVAYYRIQVLERLGYISWQPGKSRTIRLLKQE